jgi:hypothetical protein
MSTVVIHLLQLSTQSSVMICDFLSGSLSRNIGVVTYFFERRLEFFAKSANETFQSEKDFME